MSDQTIKIKPQLLEQIKTLCKDNSDIILVSLCTTDGFSIMSYAAKSLSTEADKLAAMSSTISALSDSVATQILDDDFDITIIEADHGNMLFVSTRYLDNPCVLTLAAKSNTALATARYKTKGLAKSIESIEL